MNISCGKIFGFYILKKKIKDEEKNEEELKKWEHVD